MLKIRLSRGGKNKSAFYRIVLTEHTKPIKCGYKEVLGWFDPINHKMEVNADRAKELITQGAQPSSRAAKLIHTHTKDEFFKKYIIETSRVRKSKKEDAAK